MTQQPEALRLAQRLEDYVKYYDDAPKAAAELRRLHETRNECERQYQAKVDEVGVLIDRIAALEAALGQAVEALEKYHYYTLDMGHPNHSTLHQGYTAIATARQTLGGGK